MNLWSSPEFSTLESLACDEALFHHVEKTGESWLRLWRPAEPTVVLGYAHAAASEADLEFCGSSGIAINRRISGGGTVVLLEGCLCYSLALPIIANTPFELINSTNRFIMETNRCALEERTGGPVKVEGVSDLALNGRKCSGNAQKRGRRALLFHGSFLLNADLGLVANCLRHPTLEPEWRSKRVHTDFITNLNCSFQDVESAIANAWQADPSEPPPLREEIERLADQRYRQEYWPLCR
jgi:lipoate-protein ligase A